MEVKEAIKLAHHMAGQKQRAASLADGFGDTYSADMYNRDVEALEMLIDIAERSKADAD